MGGNQPVVETMVLTRDADYVHRYQVKGADRLPAASSAEIVITATSDTDAPIVDSWPAETVTEEYIDFWVQVEDTNPIPIGYVYRLMVHYPPTFAGGPVQDWCWFRGKVKREQ